MNENVRLALLAEQKIKEVTQDIVQEIDRNINAIQKSEKSKLKEIAPNIFIANLSDLDSRILSPSYYIMSSQAKCVSANLSKSKSLTDMMTRIRIMINDGFVQDSKTNTRIKLNKNVLSVMKEYAENNLEMHFD